MGILDFIGSVWQAILTVIGVDVDKASQLAENPDLLAISIAVAVVAGASLLFGQSAILAFNRIRGWRFAVTLLLNGVAMALLYLVQAGLIYLIGPSLSGHQVSFQWVVIAVMLSTAPLTLGLFVLIPYLGPAISVFLNVWGFAALWILIDVIFSTDRVTALWIAGLGWAGMQLLSRAFAVPIKWVADGIWRMISGHSSMVTGSDLLSGHLFLPLEQNFEDASPLGGAADA